MLPCVVILYLHPVVIGLWMIPYPLRGLRAVILSHKGGFPRAVDIDSENCRSILQFREQRHRPESHDAY